MIDLRTDLSDIDKMHYLKSALVGEAANKIKIFEVDGINYSKTQKLLERSYEVKRILIQWHLSLIINLPTLNKKTMSGLSKLVDEVQQHLASLVALNVSVVIINTIIINPKQLFIYSKVNDRRIRQTSRKRLQKKTNFHSQNKCTNFCTFFNFVRLSRQRLCFETREIKNARV